ncbi:MAG: hypothetical protein OEY14_05350 [Myxococcales bacterium]|nr:hypothetical protein [Myxococcales bacterium]
MPSRSSSEAGRAPLEALTLLATLALLGCGEEPATQGRPGAAPPGAPEAEERLGPAEEEALYDAEGRLLESQESVAWLVLPRGLRAERDEPNAHIYRTNVPLEKLHRYFGPRLLTGAVDRIGDGSIFRAAAGPGRDPHEPRLEVSLLSSSRGGVRIEITEQRPVQLADPEARARELEEDFQGLD